MKSGTRALGIAESYHTDKSAFAGVISRADRVVDGFSFSYATVGGLDSTDTIIELYRSFDRKDIQYILISGIAPAWYNIVDLHRIHSAVEIPVISISFEESSGLASAIRDEFTGEARNRRLKIYDAQPQRQQLYINGHDLYYRVVGETSEHPETVIEEFTPEG
ncbi:MAG: DUF99 family protein, partial [Halobacteriaceae archaeon]